MTNTQRHLLKLIKEIDMLCRKNNIVYYLAGGSAIGAIRHRGYIPWDDDADILMTRDNYCKFLEICQTQLPDNRKILCPELNREYHNNFARYVDTTTTAIHTNQIIHNDAAGFVIDILVLDPIPDDEKLQKKYIKNLLLYADLINPATIYSFRWRMNFFNYYIYRCKIRFFGRDKVLKKLEKKMFSYKDEACNKYILRWAGVPLISDKDIYGKGKDYWFEGLRVMLPERAADYLTWHYGSNWMFLPPHTERSTHNAVYCFDTPYTVIKEEAYQYYDIEKTKKQFLRRKLLLFLIMRPWWFYKDLIAKKTQRKLSDKYENYFKRKESKIKKAFKFKKYGKLINYYHSYFHSQNKRSVIGREDFNGINRFRYPIFIAVSDEFFSIGIRLLIATGDTSKALRFLAVKEQRKALNEENRIEQKYILDLEKSISLFAQKEYEESLEIVRSLLKQNIECISTVKLYVRLLQKQEEKHTKEEILATIRYGEKLTSRIYSERKDMNGLKFVDGEWIKYRADLLENKEEKLEKYLYAYPITLNGIVKLEIQDYIQEEYDAIVARLEHMYEQKDISCVFYAQQLRLILPKDDIICSLWAKYQALKKNTPKKKWNIIYELRKSMEELPISKETEKQFDTILTDIVGDSVVSEYYKKIIFTSAISELKDIKHKLEEDDVEEQWKCFLRIYILYKCGERKEAIQNSITLYVMTDNSNIRYILCLIFRLELMITSSYLLDRTSDVTEERLQKRNSVYIAQWKEIYKDYFATITMYKKLKVLSKKTCELLQNNEETDFNMHFFTVANEDLNKSSFSPTAMIRKIYGLDLFYNRNK